MSVIAAIFALAMPMADAAETRHSIGLSDSLGVMGVYSYKLSDPEKFGDAFLTVGTTFLILGGGGVGYQKHFGDGHWAPYLTSTAMVWYALPAMCSVSPCSTKYTPILSGSGGLELRTLREGRTNFHLQAGIWSGLDLSSWGVFESPSDKPSIWPVINVAWSSSR